MRIIGLLVLLLITITPGCFADDIAAAPEDIAIPTTVAAKEARTYQVKVEVKGTMGREGSPEPIKLDVAYSLKLQHKYGARDAENKLPVEISFLEGEISAGGQEESLQPRDFPKLTALLDKDWRIWQVFGTYGTDYNRSKPGINYVNMLLLFYLYDGDRPHAIGEEWEAKAKLPVYQEIYTFTNLIKAVEEVKGVKAAAVQQEIAWTPRKEAGLPYATAKATALSSFSVTDGKLLRSHVDGEISFWGFKQSSSGQQDQKTSTANIKLDITLL